MFGFSMPACVDSSGAIRLSAGIFWPNKGRHQCGGPIYLCRRHSTFSSSVGGHWPRLSVLVSSSHDPFRLPHPVLPRPGHLLYLKPQCILTVSVHPASTFAWWQQTLHRHNTHDLWNTEFQANLKIRPRKEPALVQTPEGSPGVAVKISAAVRPQDTGGSTESGLGGCDSLQEGSVTGVPQFLTMTHIWEMCLLAPSAFIHFEKNP